MSRKRDSENEIIKSTVHLICAAILLLVGISWRIYQIYNLALSGGASAAMTRELYQQTVLFALSAVCIFCAAWAIGGRVVSLLALFALYAVSWYFRDERRISPTYQYYLIAAGVLILLALVVRGIRGNLENSREEKRRKSSAQAERTDAEEKAPTQELPETEGEDIPAEAERTDAEEKAPARELPETEGEDIPAEPDEREKLPEGMVLPKGDPETDADETPRMKLPEMRTEERIGLRAAKEQEAEEKAQRTPEKAEKTERRPARADDFDLPPVPGDDFDI